MKKIIFSALCIIAIPALAGAREVPLNKGWILKQSDKNVEVPAKVPGTVHTDLQAAGIISDPFLGNNNLKLKWIEESEWIYELSFNYPAGFDRSKPVKLIFEGLDTYAEVWLNGILILKASNMFRRQEIECNRSLLPVGNKLKVVFMPVNKLIKERSASLPFALPGGEWAWIRKAAYHFGWDWCPRFVTCGIWRPVYLLQEEQYSLEDLFFRTIRIDNKSAEMEYDLTLKAPKSEICNVKIVDMSKGQILSSVNQMCIAGAGSISGRFTISDPKLWWPNGEGEPVLYKLAVRIKPLSGRLIEKRQEVGIRKVEMISEADKTGASFCFRINGKPVFIKGANLVPPQSFIPSVSDSAWIALAEDARKSNFNMLRVWGGGIYPPDVFMKACSEKGILIWQDFMFACSMYPWNSEFLDDVKREAEEQVKRMRPYASLAMWCGNNEIDEGWHNWGWKKQIDSVQPEYSDSLWNGYCTLFRRVLPEVVAENDPGRAYWQSSPQYGWGDEKSIFYGDSHYWGVWWGNEPFSVFGEKIPRFMSEYGFQGSPVSETVKSFSTDGKSMPDSLMMLAHQKHPTGYETIDLYMKREELYPGTLEEWIYFSQITQCIGYRRAIEEHRFAKPRCMGTLYWQLNDCWPVVSWSGIDSYGRWKPVQYAIREAYDNVLVSCKYKDSEIIVRIVNDSVLPLSGEMYYAITDTSGKVISEKRESMTLYPDQPIQYIRRYRPENPQEEFLYGYFKTSGRIYEGFALFDVPGLLRCPDPDIKYSIKGDEIILKTSKPAFFLQITGKNRYLQLDNNYFNMLPGREYVVKSDSALKDSITVKSLYDYLQKK